MKVPASSVELYETKIFTLPTAFSGEKIRISPKKNVATVTIAFSGKYSYNKIQIREVCVKELLQKIDSTATITRLPAFQMPRLPALPNIHKVLSVFYILLGFFGLILIANISSISTTLGFYQFIGNFGIFATALIAVFYIYHIYRQDRERSVL